MNEHQGPAPNAKYKLYLAAMTIAALVTLEVGTRLFLPSTPRLERASDNPALIWELNPKFPEINSMGLRQPEVDLATLKNNFTIAVIGDSHTYSTESKYWYNSFPARMEHHLASLGAKNVKILNFGLPGSNTSQQLEILRTKVLPLKVDLVVLQYCINDEHISNYIQPKHPWLNRLIHAGDFYSRLWRNLLYSSFGSSYLQSTVEEYFPDLLLHVPGLVGTRLPNDPEPAHAPHPPRTKDRVPERYHHVIGRDNLERYTKAFGQLASEAGISAVATGFIERKDEALYRGAGFSVFSFFEMFEGHNMLDYGYDVRDTSDHFSDRGADFIGLALAQFIKRNYPLP